MKINSFLHLENNRTIKSKQLIKLKIIVLTLLSPLGAFSQTWNTPSINSSELYFNVDGADPSIKYHLSSGFTFNSKSGGDMIFMDGNAQTNLVINGTNGFVGIGTLTPASKLDITNGFLRFSTGFGITSEGGASIQTGPGGKTFSIQAGGPDGQITDFKNSEGNTKIRIDFEGKMGIGTTTPTHPLEIIGKTMLSNVGGETLLLNPDGENRQGIISSNFKLAFIADKVNTLGSDKKIIFGAGGETPEDPNFQTYMVINQGKVGIGTSEFGQNKLAVEGTIGAREIKVLASGWSDYVFEKDYPLKSIPELEEFIITNQHLPDIPSESEVLENGIELGKMDAKLLQKIEELTLYIIEINKRLSDLELENKKLKSQNNP